MSKVLNTAVILAGGRGLRLNPLTNDRPKSMIDVLNKPLLQWTIESLAAQGIRKIVIGVAYKKEILTEYFKDGEKFGVDIKYSVHSVDGGTAEGFRLAISRFVKDTTFIAMNGDELIDIDFRQLYKFHLRYKPIATMVIKEMKSPFGVLKIDSNADITMFQEKPSIPGFYVNTGVYVFDKDILSYIPENGGIEHTTFKVLAESRKLKGFIHSGFWCTVNNPKELVDAERILKSLETLKSEVRA